MFFKTFQVVSPRFLPIHFFPASGFSHPQHVSVPFPDFSSEGHITEQNTYFTSPFQYLKGSAKAIQSI